MLYDTQRESASGYRDTDGRGAYSLPRQNEKERVIPFERKPIPGYKFRTAVTVEFLANLCLQKSLSKPLRSIQSRAKMEYSGNN